MNNAIKVVSIDARTPKYVINIDKNPRGEYDSVSIQYDTPFCMRRRHMNTILANTTTWVPKFKPISHNATQTPSTNFTSTK